MSEEWKDVKGYEGFYRVSNKGRILSLKRATTKEHLLNPHINQDGYYTVSLSKKGKSKSVRVHRVVAENFIDNPFNYPVINHKDENKLNNSVDNLEWCTVKYNTRYKNMHIRRMNYRRRPIIAERDGIASFYACAGDAANSIGIARGNISSCAYNKYGRKSLKGYTFRFATAEEIKQAEDRRNAQANKSNVNTPKS